MSASTESPDGRRGGAVKGIASASGSGPRRAHEVTPAGGSGRSPGTDLWRVAHAIAWRSLHTYVRRPDLFIPSLVFPLIFLASFAGGLSALGSVPGFDFPAGYTAFQFVFVLLQASMFAGLFTGFTVAFDFESGFARRLMLAAGNRRGIVLGYALVALTRAAITLIVVTTAALVAGMRMTGDGVDLFGLYGLAALLVLVGFGWAAGVAFRFRTIQAGPLMQTPVFLILFLAPVYVPLTLLKGWIHVVASVNPATAFLDTGRGLISGVHDHTALAFGCALVSSACSPSGRSPGCVRPSARRRRAGALPGLLDARSRRDRDRQPSARTPAPLTLQLPTRGQGVRRRFRPAYGERSAERSPVSDQTANSAISPTRTRTRAPCGRAPRRSARARHRGRRSPG